MALDPDDSRPPYIQIASALRAAILTKAVKGGEKLPSRNELAKRYDVAPMTVQSALRLLREEGLIVSRQGSGVFVRERTDRPVGLGPLMERAFSADHITLDFAGFSGESLTAAVQPPLDKIRIGRYTPESIHVRILVPDPEVPWALPSTVEDHSDSPEFRKRMEEIMRRNVIAIVDNVTELGEIGLVKEVTAQVRVHPVAPMFKLYVLNGKDMFLGFYPIREREHALGGRPQAIYDLDGSSPVLLHHSRTDDDASAGTQYVDQGIAWFDSVWSTIARKYKYKH
ncbi:GntR family transcriptional regulator [Actinomycetes bacterium KLBMP 9759]